MFVTTSCFSKQALDYAKALQQRVILIDGARLTDLMVEFGVGVRVSRVIEVKRLDEDFFTDDARIWVWRRSGWFPCPERPKHHPTALPAERPSSPMCRDCLVEGLVPLR